MLQVSNLSCTRDERELFSSVSFQLAAGEILHIEGENGTGKTTLLRILCGLIPASSGEVYWQGRPILQQPYEWHRQLFWLGQSSGNKQCLTVIENIKFWHPTAANSEIEQALNQVALNGFEFHKIQHLSTGQQRRVALARLWLTKASVWILDEPLTALDSPGIQLLTRRFKQHCQSQGRLILTTHQAWAEESLGMQHLSLVNAACL